MMSTDFHSYDLKLYLVHFTLSIWYVRVMKHNNKYFESV
jgi:hypothetical protein